MTHILKTLCLLFFCWQVNMATAFAVIRYVKPEATGLGTGTDWENASFDLQAMLNASDSGDEVWVSSGTYKPTEFPPDCINCSSPRDYTFFVPDGVKLYGGFVGCETDIAQRNLSGNITMLSGNIGSVSSSSDNCYHVLLAVAPSIGGIGVTIDGFTVTLGSDFFSGATQIIVGGNNIERSNGAGIHIVGGTNYISNNKINKNYSYRGSGIFILNSVSSYITNNSIRENTGQVAGGISINGGNNTITNNNISDNILDCCPSMIGNAGAGILVTNGNNIISYNFISGNQANHEGTGAGISTSQGTNYITNNIITNNYSSSEGGGVWTENGNNTITDNLIMGNISGQGGGVSSTNGTNNFINNVIINNSANYGGGILVRFGTYNCVNNSIVSNTATNSGGGICTVNTSNTILTNNILWDNKKGTSTNISSADYYHSSGTAGTFYNNLFQLPEVNYTYENTGNFGIGTDASGNLFAQDPMFVNALNLSGSDGIYRTYDDGLYPIAESPVINAGYVIGVPDTDIVGNIRSDQPDIGAYEYYTDTIIVTDTVILAKTIHVDASIIESGNGESWETAFATLTEALLVAHASPWEDTVKVAAGTYIPGQRPIENNFEICSPYSRDVTFHLPDGLVLLGGYPSGGGIRNAAANATILSGDIGEVGNIADNAYHVVFAQAPTTGGLGVVLDGFTISGGNSNGTGSITLNSGVFNRSYGGGVFLSKGNNKVLNNTFTNNASINQGGAIYTFLGYNTIDNNVLVDNKAYYGGAIYANGGANVLQNNVVFNNTADFFGGGLYLPGGDNTVTNNIVWQNVANHGGGIYSSLGNNSYTNNTIASNTANNNGGGVYTYTGSTIFTNNIFSDNKSGVSNAIPGSDYYNFNGANTFIHNLLQLPDNNYTTVNYDLGIEATGNLFAQDPMFVNIVDIDGYDNTLLTEDDGLRLVVGSPALNAGITNINIPLTDIMGNTRDAQPDLGAYEGEMPVGIKLTSASYITHFTAHPNPAGEATTITFTTPTSDDIMLTLLDIHGHHITQLFAGTIQPSTNYLVALDVSRLPAGTYFALMHCANGSRQQIPIIVVR